MDKLKQFRDKYSIYVILWLLAIGFSALYAESVILGVIATISFSVVGIDIVIVGLAEIKKVRASRNWPSLEAKVVELQNSWVQLKKYSHYRLDIRYQYSINAQSFEGDRYFWNQKYTSKNKEIIDRVVDRIKANENAISIFVNPNDHSDSVIEPKLFWYLYLGPIVGIAMFFGFGFFALALAGIIPMPEWVTFQRTGFSLF